MRRIVTVAVLGLAACGADTQGSLRDQIEGEWTVLDAKTGCAEVLAIRPETVRVAIVCTTSATAAQAEVYEGPYELDGDLLRFSPSTSSCPPPYDGPDAWTVRREGAQLVTEHAGGVVAYDQLPPSTTPGGVSVTYGCWSADGFEPRALSAL